MAFRHLRGGNTVNPDATTHPTRTATGGCTRGATDPTRSGDLPEKLEPDDDDIIDPVDEKEALA